MIIYKTTNMANGKIYVGQTTTNDKNYIGSGLLLKRAISKYGRESFIRETLCECYNQDELNEMERHWIQRLDSQNSSIGYNIDNGGNSPGKMSEESIRKAVESRKNNGKDSHWIGRKHSDKSKKKMCESSMGTTPWNKGISGYTTSWKGRTHTEETKNKLRQKALGRKHTDESKKKMSESRKGKPHPLPPKTEDWKKNHSVKMKEWWANRKAQGI